MKKIGKIISLIVVVLLLVVVGFYLYNNNQVTENKENINIEAGDYSELTEDVIAEIGGQEIADGLIEKYEKAVLDLDEAIQKYEEGGKIEEDKPSVILFVEVGKYAKYIRKYEVAADVLESVFDYYEKSNIALINLAHVYEDEGEFQKAIDTYQRFYAMFPEENQFQFHVYIMQDFIALGNKEKVAELYKNYKDAGFANEEIEQYVSNL